MGAQAAGAVQTLLHTGLSSADVSAQQAGMGQRVKGEVLWPLELLLALGGCRRQQLSDAFLANLKTEAR